MEKVYSALDLNKPLGDTHQIPPFEMTTMVRHSALNNGDLCLIVNSQFSKVVRESRPKFSMALGQRQSRLQDYYTDRDNRENGQCVRS